MFDEDNLVSCAGLVPLMSLAQQTGLSRLLADKTHIATPRITSGSANPAPKLATLIAGMCGGADCIDDIDVIRSGGMKTLFGGVYAPSTVGTLLREFTFSHARQLESVLREHLVAVCGRVDLLPGADEQVFIDIDFAAASGLHNLLRAAGVLAGDRHTRARGSTLRRTIINVPARLARPQHRPVLHLPTHWPWSKAWLALWHNTIGHSPPLTTPL